MAEKKRRLIKGFYLFLRPLIRIWLKGAYHIKLEGEERLKTLEPPFFVMGNHVTTFDPFMIAMCMPHYVHWVASDNVFRNRFVAFLLRAVGAVPKMKSRSDLETIKFIMGIVKNGGVVGLFPEGQRTWDGHTLPIIYATAKLVRMMKIPVLMPQMRGGFLSLPRWARNKRRGEIVLDYSRVLMPGEIAGMGTKEIAAVMQRYLEYDEAAWQEEVRIPYRSKRKAEGLEFVLYTCPECRGYGTMKARGNLYQCSGCGFSVQMDVYGRFQRGEGEPPFSTIRGWNLWQEGLLRERLDRLAAEQILFADSNTALFCGYRSKPLKPIAEGEFRLYRDRTEFVANTGQVHRFPVEKMEGVNIQIHEPLDFYFQGRLYRVRSRRRRYSALKWKTAVDYLASQARGEGEEG